MVTVLTDDHSICRGTGIELNLERMTQSSRFLLEIFTLIVTMLRNMS
jgi:hypothetical protein